MTDRLSIINDALIGTGNATVNVEYDGSDEWEKGDSAYRRAVAFLISRHRWNFAKAKGVLGSEAVSNPSSIYTYGLQIPADCLHVEAVYLGTKVLTQYELIDRYICCDYDSSAGLTVQYVVLPTPDKFPVLWIELLTMKTEAQLLRSLNEDTPGAVAKDRDVEMLLMEARPLSDQQEPARAFRVSPSLHRRRTGGMR